MNNEEKTCGFGPVNCPDGFAEPPRVKSAPSPMDALRGTAVGAVPIGGGSLPLAVGHAAKADPLSVGVRGGGDHAARPGVLGAIVAAMGRVSATKPADAPAPLAVAAEPPGSSVGHQDAHEGHQDRDDARSATIVAVRHWSLLGPACGRCWSHWYTETELSTGDEVLTCYCCRAAVDGESKLAEWEAVKAKRVAAREGTDGAEVADGAEAGKDGGKPRKRQSK